MRSDLLVWNDVMYRKHPTPYGRGIAGAISAARVRTVLRLAAIRPVDRVLEIGCESGHLLLALPPCGLRLGADISRAALADAQARTRSATAVRVAFTQIDAARPLPVAPGRFDVIIISEMLEHVADPRIVLEQVHAIATPETRIVITVPNERPKLLTKRVLKRLRLFDLLLPGIEAGQSEWHLQQFDKPMIHAMVEGLFALRTLESVWGAHYAALLARLP